MSTEGTVTQVEALERFVANRIGRVRTVTIARVERWDATTQTIDAQPLIREPIEVRPSVLEQRDMPVIPSVPFNAALTVGGFTIQAAPAVGDVVLLLVLDRDPDAYLSSTGGVQDAASPRRHMLTDAVALPIGVPRTGAPLPDIGSDELVVGRQDGSGEVRVRQDGSVAIGARDSAFRRAARENDQTTSSPTEDAAFWTWVSAVDAFIAGVGAAAAAPTLAPLAAPASTYVAAAAAVGGAPSSQTGRISSGSDALEVE